jgi:hypothetical protein
MPRPLSGPRKRRTREHVIAEMSVNHVERLILKRGHSLERIVHDYGIDALLFTYDRNGETENAWIPMQIKATDRIRFVGQRQFVSIRVDRSDLRSWLTHLFPVILILYDARKVRAYWLYLQAHFGVRRFAVSSGVGKVTIRIPASQVLNSAAIDRIVSFRDAVIEQIEGEVEHHD